MANAFSEAVARPAGSQLRQGDVLEAVDATSTVWTRHLLVVTADCDFANGKHSGRVTCVPLLPAEEYLLHFLFPGIRDKTLARLIRESKEILKKASKPLISDARLLEWAIEVDEVEILISALDLNHPLAESFATKITAVRALSSDFSSLEKAMTQIVNSQQAYANPIARDKVILDLRSSILNRYRSTPGDALFLSSIAPGYHDGYFAYLRHIEQVWESAVVTAPSKSPATYRRIGALADRFSHAAVQRFAMVFMPIGLSDEYEELRTTHAELITEMIR